MKRLAWAGHVARMNSDRILKKIFNTKSEGGRSVGRPKLRWEDGVNQDTKTQGAKNWKNAALERRSFSRRAGPTRSCRANYDDGDEQYGVIRSCCIYPYASFAGTEIEITRFLLLILSCTLVHLFLHPGVFQTSQLNKGSVTQVVESLGNKSDKKRQSVKKNSRQESN